MGHCSACRLRVENSGSQKSGKQHGFCSFSSGCANTGRFVPLRAPRLPPRDFPTGTVHQLTLRLPSRTPPRDRSPVHSSTAQPGTQTLGTLSSRVRLGLSMVCLKVGTLWVLGPLGDLPRPAEKRTTSLFLIHASGFFAIAAATHPELKQKTDAFGFACLSSSTTFCVKNFGCAASSECPCMALTYKSSSY